jgi:hypothetical protein
LLALHADVCVTQISAGGPHKPFFVRAVEALAYQYDKLNRLSTVTVPGQASASYGYEL